MEDKKYEIEGTVTLRTQDFLDIFAESISAKKECEITANKYYSALADSRRLEETLKLTREELAIEKARAGSAQKDASVMKDELSFLYDFIHSDEAVSALFSVYAKGKADSNA